MACVLFQNFPRGKKLMYRIGLLSLVVVLRDFTTGAVLASDAASGLPETTVSASTKLPHPDLPFLQRLHAWLKAPTIPLDIDPKLFDDFWLDWKLVTVRYKIDGNEMRFIYVNKIGAEAIAKGVYPYPKGTVFAKIGAEAVHDPIFDNSLIPGPIGRVQIMLKKPGDPNARDGWVYGLYMQEKYLGHLSKEDIDDCHACHVVAKSRDMIFAQPFPVAPSVAPPAAGAGSAGLRARFKTTSVDALAKLTRRLVLHEVPGTKDVMALTMPAFEGTMFEMREVLARFAREGRTVYVLNNEDSTNVLMAIPGKNMCVKMGEIMQNAPTFWTICARK